MSDYPGRSYVRTRKHFAAILAELLDDGSGRVAPALQPLADRLVAMPKPDRGMTWLRNNANARQYLQGLATGAIPMTHDALSALDSWRTAAHLRDLLMDSGALPAVDRQTTLFSAWAATYLSAVADPAHARLLKQFTTWHLLPRLHRTAARHPLTAGSRHNAAQDLSQGATLLAWITERASTPAELSQALLDTWQAEHPSAAARTFLRWALRGGHLPTGLVLHSATRPHGEPISAARRLTWTRRVLTDDSLDLRTRVAGALLLLYAQPLPRIVRLTLDDITYQPAAPSPGSMTGTTTTTVAGPAGEPVMLLRLGEPPVPVPAPLDQLIAQLAANRVNMNTATNPTCRWLFPGGRSSQPLTEGALRQHFQALGMPTVPARTSALRTLTLQAPAPVVATALGYDPTTTEQHRTRAGGDWSRYTTLDR